MSSTNKRPRTERLAASVLPGTAVPRQPSNGVAVGSHISEGRTCQPAPSLGRAAGAQDTHGDVLAHLKTCAQGLWGRCAGRNKEDAATLVEGLSALQSRQHAEHSRASALEARVHKLEAQLAQPAPALPLAQASVEEGPAQQLTPVYRMTGRPAVGETVALVAAGGAPPPSDATLQWLSSKAHNGPWRPIVGASDSMYSPDPND